MIDLLPFAGLLVSIALLPMVAPRLWHHRMGVIAFLWSAALLVPLAVRAGPSGAAHAAWHALLADYLPFISLLTALYAAGGGIQVRGGPFGRPAGNTLLLAVGTVLAGIMGTTGAAMVLIHPLLRANAHRHRRVHLVLFFIVLVANAGGATSPLGDPPLFIGFLRGVPFDWPVRALTAPLLVMAVPILAVFYGLDRVLIRADPADPADRQPLHLRGGLNVALVGLCVAGVLLQGIWRPGDAVLGGVAIGWERLAAIALFIAIAGLSVIATPRAIREANLFTWHPMIEVAKLFAAIFVTIAPVLTLLDQGQAGPAAPLLRLAAHPDGTLNPMACFWIAGLLSAFLDNAPTYLVFFQIAGGDAAHLAGPDHVLLAAISAGSVFFGALTYIGNAPNLMVRAIAAHRGVRMPGFFAYMLFAAALMLPGLLGVAAIFFRSGP